MIASAWTVVGSWRDACIILAVGTGQQGGMLSSEGERFMEAPPHLALWSGVALSSVVYATNMFGDPKRDLLGPRLRGGAKRQR